MGNKFWAFACVAFIVAMICFIVWSQIEYAKRHSSTATIASVYMTIGRNPTEFVYVGTDGNYYRSFSILLPGGTYGELEKISRYRNE